jgi:hypothetical protein
MANDGSNTMLRFSADLDELRWRDWPLLLASDFEVDWRFTETPYKSIFETAPKRYCKKSPDPSAEDFCTLFGTTRGERCRIKTEWKPTPVERSIWI